MEERIAVRLPKSLFAGAITQDNGLYADVLLPRALQGPGGTAMNLLKSLTIKSQENLAWDLWFYATKQSKISSNADTDSWLGHWAFLTSDAATVEVADPGTNSTFKYFTIINDLALRDDDQLGQLHIGLIPRGASKGATQIQIELYLASQYTGM